MPELKSKFWSELGLIVFSLALCALASYRFLHSISPGFPLDDAYIHLCYARNLAEGAGFCFNKGGPSFGTSSPLWVFILALWIKRSEPHLLIYSLSGFFFWLGLYFSMLIMRRNLKTLSLDRFSEFLFIVFPAVFLTSIGNYLWITFSGMETSLWIGLSIVAVYFLIRPKPRFAGYIVLGLGALARLNVVLLILLVLFWQMIFLKERKKLALKFLPSFLIPLAFHIWAKFSLGSFLPTTHSGKLASHLFESGFSPKAFLRFLEGHLIYLKTCAPELIFGLGLVFLGLTLIWLLRKPAIKIGQIGVFCGFVCGIFAYHSLFFRSVILITPYQNFRYQALFFPLLALGLSWVGAQIFSLSKNLKVKIFVGASLIVILGVSFGHFDFWKRLYKLQAENLRLVHRKAGEWIAKNLHQTAKIASFDIGAIGFYSQRKIIDLGGLINPDIHPFLKRKETGKYLHLKKPDYYIELKMPDCESILGVRKYLGRFYSFVPLVAFSGKMISEPVVLHSWALKVHRFNWLK